jgi:hypothetical protein
MQGDHDLVLLLVRGLSLGRLCTNVNLIEIFPVCLTEI